MAGVPYGTLRRVTACVYPQGLAVLGPGSLSSGCDSTTVSTNSGSVHVCLHYYVWGLTDWQGKLH